MTSRGERNLPRPTQDRTKAASLTAKLRELFGKVAEAVTGKPTPSATGRRKRREEGKSAFKRAVVLTARILRSLFHATNDDEQTHIETERLLRLQIDEWAREEETLENDAGHCQHHAAVDLKL